MCKRKLEPNREMQLLMIKKHGKKSIYACKKSNFLHKKYAEMKLAQIEKEDALSDKKPIRAYQCSKCGFWHLTSLPSDVFYELTQSKYLASHRLKIRETIYWENKLKVA